MDYRDAHAAMKLPWRTGTKRGFPGEGQTIYAQLGAEPDPGRDPFIGVMFARELAKDACRAHNAALEVQLASPAWAPITGWGHSGPCPPGCTCSMAKVT